MSTPPDIDHIWIMQGAAGHHLGLPDCPGQPISLLWDSRPGCPEAAGCLPLQNFDATRSSFLRRLALNTLFRPMETVPAAGHF